MRPFRANDDLRAMQELVQDAWAVCGPKVRHHVGDLAWGEIDAGGSKRALLEENGRVLAWGRLHAGVLDFEVHPERPGLLDEVLDWAPAATTTVTLASNEAAAELLRGRGWSVDEDAYWFAYLQRDLDDLPETEPPDGYRVRAVRGEQELAERTNVHRAAWAPSQLTEEKVRRLMRTWPYRPELDCVGVAPDGSFASSTLAWLDDRNRVGEFEPVGTAPAHRRLGLGRAVNVFALAQLRSAGAESAVVYCRGDAAYPVPKLLYESVGFRRHDRTVTWVCPT